jgi:hypothetical protein
MADKAGIGCQKATGSVAGVGFEVLFCCSLISEVLFLKCNRGLLVLQSQKVKSFLLVNLIISRI